MSNPITLHLSDMDAEVLVGYLAVILAEDNDDTIAGIYDKLTDELERGNN